MLRIFDIASKDLLQIVRNRLTFLFLLIMPIGFTLLFGFAFGGLGGKKDTRLPIGYLDQDGGQVSRQLGNMLRDSTIIRLEENELQNAGDLEKLVGDEKLAAALVVPLGYSQSVQAGNPAKLVFIANPVNPSSQTVQGAVIFATNRVLNAATMSRIIVEKVDDSITFDQAFSTAMISWQQPPIQVSVTTRQSIKPQNQGMNSPAHSSSSMMLQFAIAGLLTAATVIVNERKTRSLQRMLTTASSRVHILLGHYLAIFTMIFGQFTLLIIFGQLVLKVDYLRQPLATLLVAGSSAACIAAMGLLIGVLARSDEQAIIFSLIPMFVLSALGGAWVPLEATSSTFQAVGHFSPVAWALDGFKDIVVRGLAINSILLPSAALIGYAALFFLLASWKFLRSQEM